jgi:hypothetical protein
VIYCVYLLYIYFCVPYLREYIRDKLYVCYYLCMVWCVAQQIDAYMCEGLMSSMRMMLYGHDASFSPGLCHGTSEGSYNTFGSIRSEKEGVNFTNGTKNDTKSSNFGQIYDDGGSAEDIRRVISGQERSYASKLCHTPSGGPHDTFGKVRSHIDAEHFTSGKNRSENSLPVSLPAHNEAPTGIVAIAP